jgi:hypothetical protein
MAIEESRGEFLHCVGFEIVIGISERCSFLPFLKCFWR